MTQLEKSLRLNSRGKLKLTIIVAVSVAPITWNSRWNYSSNSRGKRQMVQNFASSKLVIGFSSKWRKIWYTRARIDGWNCFSPQVLVHANQTHFHMKGFARWLVLKPRHRVCLKASEMACGIACFIDWVISILSIPAMCRGWFFFTVYRSKAGYSRSKISAVPLLGLPTFSQRYSQHIVTDLVRWCSRHFVRRGAGKNG